MRVLLALMFAAAALPITAQTLPVPSVENPRLQTIQYVEGQRVQLTMLPSTGLTVMLEPGEQIMRVSVGDDRLLDVRVSAERDSLMILPLALEAAGAVDVQTMRRSYRFTVTTASSLTAAYLVQFTYGAELAQVRAAPPEPTGELWAYRLRGDRSVRPMQITDDGVRTYVTFAADQALPAMFAIGPTGEEQVVDGYMRDDRFVIDRVHSELVFRIDKDKATARRNSSPEAVDG